MITIRLQNVLYDFAKIKSMLKGEEGGEEEEESRTVCVNNHGRLSQPLFARFLSK